MQIQGNNMTQRQVYLALYKYKKPVRNLKTFIKRFLDEIIRFFTKSRYSHCEIAIERSDGYYDCYSASPRDSGVRYKRMALYETRWELIPVAVAPSRIQRFFKKTKGKQYDLWGALAIALVLTKHRKNRYFCSEWCWEALGGKDGWRFSPAQLGAIFQLINNGEKHD